MKTMLLPIGLVSLGAMVYSFTATNHVYAQLSLPSWFPAVWSQSLTSPLSPDAQPEQPPSTIPQFQEFDDPSGRVATYQPNGSTSTVGNAFFSSLGTNGRTCFSCH